MKEVVTVITTSCLIIANKQVMPFWMGIEILKSIYCDISRYFDILIL